MHEEIESNRPKMKNRVHHNTWQSYLIWNELVETKKRHSNRKAAVERGDSNMDATFEVAFMEGMALDRQIAMANKRMIAFGEAEFGAIWTWLTNIHGLGKGSLAAQLLAQIDDIGKFATVSKLWCFAGLAVSEGRADYNKKGEVAHYNKRLKSICYLIMESFTKHQTPIYVDIYYAEKVRLRRMYPEPQPTSVGSPWQQNYTNGHLHAMAMRKTEKIFLQHLWVQWRTAEGLPVSEPYVQAILGHTNIITAQEITQ